jgi:hypothetical protein
MRTTIWLDDRLGMAVRKRAAEKGSSVSAFIAGVLDDALKRREPKEVKPFELVTAGGGGVHPGIDLDRIRELDVLDDEEAWGPSSRNRRDRD